MEKEQKKRKFERDEDFINNAKSSILSLATSLIKGLDSDDDFELEMALNAIMLIEDWLELNSKVRTLYSVTTENHREKLMQQMSDKIHVHPAYISPDKEKSHNEKLADSLLKRIMQGAESDE